jgi:hypothetical protein
MCLLYGVGIFFTAIGAEGFWIYFEVLVPVVLGIYFIIKRLFVYKEAK